MKLVTSKKTKPVNIMVCSLQQLLAVLAATIAVPAIVGNGMSQSAALFGAGLGTLVYLLITKFKSPVFLGSSFAFIGPMMAAFAGVTSIQMGYLGLILGATFAGLVYLILSIMIRCIKTSWIDKIMPDVVIGPVVAIIGLSLATNAVDDVLNGASNFDAKNLVYNINLNSIASLCCGLVTLFAVVVCATYGKKVAKMVPFIIGIMAGYLAAGIFTLIGNAQNIEAFKLINIMKLESYQNFAFLKAMGEIKNLNASYVLAIAVAYIPVGLVVFAEHIADHKNLSNIIGKDLIKDPGLDKTLLGDGLGSIVGAFFGGCPNTTYGESIACVALTKDASTANIALAAIMAMIMSFIRPVIEILATIPTCVMGGCCIALYGFIAVSGLKMLKNVDLNDNSNLFVVSVILITGIGGMSLKVGPVTITSVACALVLGIITNLMLKKGKQNETKDKKQTRKM